MNFFTFSSEGRGQRRKPSVEPNCILVCLGVFALLTVSWFLIARPFSGRFQPLASEVSQPPSPDWYLAYRRKCRAFCRLPRR